MRTPLLLSLSLLLLTSCQPQLGDVLKIMYSGSQEIPSEGLKITFLDIADSRCPIGVDCITAGEARIELDVEKGGATETLDLTAKGLCEDESGPCGSQVQAMGYNFKLLYVAPHPAKDVTIAKEQYVLTLVVERS
ncbi:MAG: hypothetical protein IPH04_11185 [Saprospirales bacterium]|nr:hypothetical protein [Saprospirales bacterium]